MSKSWKLDTYWRPREESTLAVAERLEKFVEMASAACLNLGRWYQTGSPKSKHWGQAINTFDKKTIERLIAKKIIKNDYGGPFEWGGYALGLVNTISAPGDRQEVVGASPIR